MSNYLDKAFRNQDFREKVGFTSGVGKVLASTVDKHPFMSMAGMATGGAMLNNLASTALGTAKRPADTQSYKIDRNLNPGISGVLDRVQADEMIASSMTKNVGEIANSMVNEVVRNMGKSYKKMMHRPTQQAVLRDLMESDEMLREADPEHVASLFNTMVDVAPRMTKYKDAVKSFLRQGIAHEGGLDPVTLGELAKAEARLGGKGLDAT
jgi:hypothetical protein